MLRSSSWVRSCRHSRIRKLIDSVCGAHHAAAAQHTEAFVQHVLTGLKRRVFDHVLAVDIIEAGVEERKPPGDG